MLLYLVASHRNKVPATRAGYVYSILAGITIAVFSIILIRLFYKGGNLSYVLPVIYGGTVIMGSLAGIFIYKETLNTLGTVGVVLATLGLALIIYSKTTS